MKFTSRKTRAFLLVSLLVTVLCCVQANAQSAGRNDNIAYRANPVTLIRSQTYSNNVAATAGSNTFNCKNFESIRCVDFTNSAGWSGISADAWLNAAIADLPTIGGTVDARGLGATTQTIAATVNLGSNSGSGKTVTLLLDRTTKFTCTITNNTPCMVRNAGSSIIGNGTISYPNAGIWLTGTSAVSNMLLTQDGSFGGGYVEGLSLFGANGATVSDAFLGVQNALQNTEFRHIGIASNGVINSVLLKIYGTAGAGVGNVEINSVSLDGSTGTGNRDVWIGCAASGSLANVSCTAGNISFTGPSAIAHGGSGLPLITVEAQNGSGGSNPVGNIGFFNTQFESTNTGDIGILVDGAESFHVYGLYASCRTHCGADIIKLAQPAGTTLDGVDIRNVDNQGGWTNTINNTILTKTLTFASGVARTNYAYNRSGAINVNVLDDADGGEAIIDARGITVPRAMPFTETASPSRAANFDVCYGDSTAHALKCSYNNGTFLQIPQVITATSAAFATATTAGTCVQSTTAVRGAATTMVVAVSPVSTPGVGAVWSGFVSSAGNVTINECAVAASAGGTIAFNIRVTP